MGTIGLVQGLNHPHRVAGPRVLIPRRSRAQDDDLVAALSGRRADFDAMDPALTELPDGAPVASWPDGSDEGHVAGNAIDSEWPSYRRGVLKDGTVNVVRFGGHQGLLSTPIDLTATDKFTVYVVASAGFPGAASTFCESGPSGASGGVGTVGLGRWTDGRIRGAVWGTDGRGATAWDSDLVADAETELKIMALRVDLSFRVHDTYVHVDGAQRGRIGAMSTTNDGSLGNEPLHLGARNVGGALSQSLVGDMARLLVFDHRHDPATMNEVGAYLADAYGLTWQPITANIVFEGDSITEGGNSYFADSWPSQLMSRLSGNYYWSNPSVSGQTISQMDADKETQITPYFAPEFPRNVMTLLAGANDMVAAGDFQPPAKTLRRYFKLADYHRNQGWTVIGFTLLPAHPDAPPDYAEQRETFNAGVRADWEGHFDALVDLEADPRIGPAGAEKDAAYFDADFIHPNAAGLAIIADLVQPAFEALGIS